MVRPWAVLCPEGGRVGLHVLGASGPERRGFASEQAAREGAGLPEARMIGLVARADADVPAPVLPAAPGEMGAIRQAAPLGLLPAAARIRVAGALAGRRDWDGIVCLPDGAVTQWVHVSAGEIVSFQGAATPRLLGAFGARGAAMDAGALGDTLARPERLAVQLQSASLAQDPAAILGHLLGAELAAMRPYWLGQAVIVVNGALPYADALAAQGVEAEVAQMGETWDAGLQALGRAVGFVD